MMTTETTPGALGSNDQLGPLVVNGVTFEPLRLPVPQIARGLPKEVHVFSREMVLTVLAVERERCARLAGYALSCAKNAEWNAADDALERIERA